MERHKKHSPLAFIRYQAIQWLYNAADRPKKPYKQSKIKSKQTKKSPNPKQNQPTNKTNPQANQINNGSMLGQRKPFQKFMDITVAFDLEEHP